LLGIELCHKTFTSPSLLLVTQLASPLRFASTAFSTLAGGVVSKKPTIDHEYHAGKDKLKITIQGYALGSKSARDKILKKMRDELERSPARLIKEAKKSFKKGAGKKLKGLQKDDKLIETGD
jgi:hypothetical protein